VGGAGRQGTAYGGGRTFHVYCSLERDSIRRFVAPGMGHCGGGDGPNDFDIAGELQMNMDLSRRRADAVLKALTTAYGVGPDRLQAYGSGPLSPVASNKDEEGKAKNRRVELVER
jgi:hypothetical protein